MPASSAQKSRRHHFAPVAYLRGWCDPNDSKLWAHYRGRGGDVRREKRAPKSVAYAFDLYAWKNEGRLSPKPSVDLEEGFFGPLDNRAALALRRLRDKGSEALDDETKEILAYFLNSLMERDPENVARMENVAKATVRDVVVEAQQRPDPYGTWKRVLELFEAEGTAINTARRAMVNRINDAPFVKWLCDQSWLVVTTDHPLFVTSDRPLLVNMDGEMPVQLLRIAISPSRLLIVHPGTWELNADLLKDLLISYNLQVAQNAWSVVIADHELRGVEAAVNYPRLLDTSLKRRTDTVLE